MVIAVLGALLLAGCATYTDRIRAAEQTIAGGDLQSAVAKIDALLNVENPGMLPRKWGSDRALLVLERGMLQQALQNYALSARDLGAADKQIDLLDLGRDPLGTVGKYIYSDSATRYRASPTEKMALNAFNMLNYLAAHDLEGARVEAKRFTVVRDYLGGLDADKVHGAFGSYLAGFVFERRGEYGGAMRYYDEALGQKPLRSLEGPVRRLSVLTSYRSARIDKLLAGGGSQRSAMPEPGRPLSELLVAVSIGRVPYKVPRRMPIGAAVGLAGAQVTGDLRLLEYGVAKFISYPELADSEPAFRPATLWIDGQPAPIELASDLGEEIRDEYDRIKVRIIAAAISRMVARAAVAEGARAAGQEAANGVGEQLRRFLGFLAALVTESALVAADRPDTRSWHTLPRRVYVYRTTLSPGRHAIALSLTGATRDRRRFGVDIAAGDYTALVITSPR